MATLRPTHAIVESQGKSSRSPTTRRYPCLQHPPKQSPISSSPTPRWCAMPPPSSGTWRTTSSSITHAAFSCFGALQGIRRGLQPDLELLYVGAMFHDIGLTDRYRTSALRFEVDGANAAREFLLDRGADEGDARKVWLSIALHTTPNVPEFLEPEIALVTAGVETDVLGIGRDDLPPDALEVVTAAHPRPDFKRRILQAFTDGMKHRPETTFGTVNADVLEHFDPSFVRDDFVDIILKNSWPE